MVDFRVNLPLVSREWKNGSNSSYNCTPFLHSLLTKARQKDREFRFFYYKDPQKRYPEFSATPISISAPTAQGSSTGAAPVLDFARVSSCMSILQDILSLYNLRYLAI